MFLSALNKRAMEEPINSRTRFTDQEKKEIMQRYRESDLSKMKFAEQNGIKYYTLINWFEKERNVAVSKVEKSFSQVLVSNEEGLFAELKTEHGFTLRFYKPIEAIYLQTLLKK